MAPNCLLATASTRPCAFTFYPWAVHPLSHFFNSLHYLFKYRFILKKYNLACRVLKCIFGDFQSLVDKQKKMRAISSTNFFNLSSQILWMPEAYQLDDNFAVFILIVSRVSRQCPRLLPIFCSNSPAKSASRRLSKRPELLKKERSEEVESS